MQPFQSFTTLYRTRIEELLESRLSSLTERQAIKVCEAMSYSLCNGGKRIRPLLVYAGALAVGDANSLTDNAAAAIEAIHCYSLIHDDLPSMDDDDLRRGQPTCHIVYNEATAILAGDALQALAFEWLSEDEYQSTLQVPMIRLLAQASGALGMVGGQAIDLAAVDQSLNLKQLSHMHRLKTGALIEASVKLGALSTGLADKEQLNALDHYAKSIGLAFQVQDDILDVTADTKTLGKQSGADIAHNKPTFVSLIGLKAAKEQTQDLYGDALNALSSFDYRADYLRGLADYIIKRQH